MWNTLSAVQVAV